MTDLRYKIKRNGGNAMSGFRYELTDTEAGTRVCSAVTRSRSAPQWMVNKQAKLNAEHGSDDTELGEMEPRKEEW
jgi:hypothetical protein